MSHGLSPTQKADRPAEASRILASVRLSSAEAALRSLVLILPLIFGAAPLQQQQQLLDRTWLFKKIQEKKMN